MAGMRDPVNTFILSLIFGIVLFILLTAMHLVFLKEESGILLDYLTALSCAFLSASSWLVFKRQYESQSSLTDSHWLFVSLGFSLWVFAEGVWAVRNSSSNLALMCNVFWLLGYVFVIYGMYKENEKVYDFIRTIREPSLRVRLVRALPFLVACVLVSYSFLLYIFVYVSSYSAYELVLENIYIILDAVLLYFSLLMMLSYNGSRMTSGLDVFSAGLLLYTLSDSSYILVGGYYPWNPLDVLYMVGYSLMGLGLIIYSRHTVVV